MVADAIVYHPFLAHVNRYTSTTVGRDKLLRTLQYASRFLQWYTYRTNLSQSTVDRFEKIKKSLGTARKAMRLGKWVEHLKAAAVAYDSKTMDPVLKWLAVGRQLGYALYLWRDNLGYLNTIGMRKAKDPKKLGQDAYRAWFFGLTCNVLAGLYTLYYLQVAAKKHADSADAEKAVEQKKLAKDRWSAQKQLIQDLCDLAAPSTALGYANFDEGIIGLAGTTSSLLGVASAWKKSA